MWHVHGVPERVDAQVLWDDGDPNVFVATNGSGQLHTYLLAQQSLSRQGLQLLATAALPSGHMPVLLTQGRLHLRLKSGVLDSWLLDTHRPLLDQDSGSGSKQLQKRCATLPAAGAARMLYTGIPCC